MVDIISTKKEIVSIVEAQANSIDDISKRFYKIENLVNTQEKRNQNIIITVIVAFIFIVFSVAMTIIASNKQDAQYYSGLESNIYEQNLKIQDLNNQILNIKVRNSYLK